MALYRLVVAMALVAAIVVVGGPAHASCAPPAGTLQQRVAKVRWAFVGTVVEQLEGDDRAAKVAVESVWQGNVKKNVVVLGSDLVIEPYSDSSVDRSYDVRTRYLFTPYRHRRSTGEYIDSICTDTRPWSRRVDAARPRGIAALRPPEPIRNTERSRTPSSERAASSVAAPSSQQVESTADHRAGSQGASPWAWSLPALVLAAGAAVLAVRRSRP